LAGREFEIGTDSFGVKDFGFNDGDEDEVIVLGDDDDNDGSVSDIFDIQMIHPMMMAIVMMVRATRIRIPYSHQSPVPLLTMSWNLMKISRWKIRPL